MTHHVLVVDDDATIRSLVALALEYEGYDVATAANGAQALEAIEQEEPSVIVLDLMMPVMDGWTFIEHCERSGRCREVPILVVSAAHDPHRVAEAPRVRGVLAKPFDVDVLLGAVQRLVNGRAGT